MLSLPVLLLRREGAFWVSPEGERNTVPEKWDSIERKGSSCQSSLPGQASLEQIFRKGPVIGSMLFLVIGDPCELVCTGSRTPLSIGPYCQRTTLLSIEMRKIQYNTIL